jgi:DNA processing protein
MADPGLVLLAAAVLRVPARRIRALALGDETALRDWIANESATRLAEARRDARAAFARLSELGGRVVSLADHDYPAGLRDLTDPPAFLCVRGTLPRARWREGTAIVGTRTADQEAAAMARALGERAPGPIVSGLARGIDAAAHEGALEAGTPTYAYVGTGLGVTYPPEHADLEDRIVAGGGAILSELLPGEGVTRWSLVRRDRLQAAHAAATVLVQSEADGGAMHTLAAARRLGRPRFALEPRAGLDPRAGVEPRGGLEPRGGFEPRVGIAAEAQSSYSGNAVAIAEGAKALPWDPALSVAWFTDLSASSTDGDDEER